MRAIQVTEIDALPIIGGSMRWHPVRRALGIRAFFGTNAYSAANNAGDRVVEEHTEQGAGHEEVYLVLEGRAEFTLGEDWTTRPPARWSSSATRPSTAAPWPPRRGQR